MNDAEGTVRFDDALARAREWLRKRGSSLGGRVLVIRDLAGRIAVLLPEERGPRHEPLAEELAAELGAYGADPDRILLSPSDFFNAEALFASPDARGLFSPRLGEDGPNNVFMLEREVIGLDWMRRPLMSPNQSLGAPEPPRLTFFGLKGGVGRTTALVLFARALARAGARVLVVDLDLESPGLGPLLLPSDRVPRFGIVDYLVEEAVGQADEALVDDILVRSPLVDHPEGEIHVVPAGGRRGDYLAKLGRIYQPAGVQGSVMELAERIDSMIARMTLRTRANIVLIDSRAGLHDLAAFSVTRLRAHALLFATGGPQTWSGYRVLFEDWMRHPSLEELRERLHVAAALVPETGRREYMERFVTASYDLFAETMYESSEGSADSAQMDLFNFDLNDDTAPHYPHSLYWSRALQEFDPVRDEGRATEDQVRLASEGFCRGLGQLVGLEVAP